MGGAADFVTKEPPSNGDRRSVSFNNRTDSPELTDQLHNRQSAIESKLYPEQTHSMRAR